MATSGSIDFTVTRDDIIKSAYRHVLADEDFTLTTNQTTNASLLLNSIVKSWNVMLHVPIWSLSYGYVLPTSNINSASIGTAVNIVSSFSVNYLASAASASATTVTLDAAPGNINGYAIGIELANGDMHWTTVNGVPVGAVVTLTVALPSAASASNFVYSYSTSSRFTRIVRIIDAYRRDVQTVAAGASTLETSIPIKVVTSSAFLNETTSFSSEGAPIKLAFEPLVSSGSIRWWPRFQNGRSYIQFRFVS